MDFRSSTVASSPRSTPTPTESGQYPGYRHPAEAQPGPPQQVYIGYPTDRPQANNNGLAVTSMVLSLVAIPFICIWIGYLLGLIGVIFGHVAHNQIKHSGQQGKGTATAGIVIGYCVLALLVLTITGLFALGASAPYVTGA